MAEKFEWMFYELMWRAYAQKAPYPMPWWIQMNFKHWMDNFDSGLFNSKEGAFSSNSNYRYWNMVGVKDYTQESLVGQCGEIEPVYDEYTIYFFLFDPASRRLYFPQDPSCGTISQSLLNNYLPILRTTWRSTIGVQIDQRINATVVGASQKSMVLCEFELKKDPGAPAALWFCLGVMPYGPTGFKRIDRAGRGNMDRLLNKMEFNPTAAALDQKLIINDNTIGPVFQTPPQFFGLYGNGTSWNDPQHYITNGPFNDLATRGSLNGNTIAVDNIAGLCTGVFAWPLSTTQQTFSLDVRLPVDDFRSTSDFRALRTEVASNLTSANETFWSGKLDGSGLQITFTPIVSHLFDLFRICRANLLILSDDGAIHPGPTIYDDFWVRDSSVEGIACALAGDCNLAIRQFSDHYPEKFNLSSDRIGPVSMYGFFGGTHEKNDQEWDSNGQALWAFGKLDRIMNGAFGAGMFYPYVIKGARWIRDNRSVYGIMNSGWSAEHIGDKSNPHFWDDFWGIAGLYEAARLAERMGAPEKDEIWGIYNSLRQATADSIRWVVNQQKAMGQWKTFIPTGPGDVNRCDSTMVGTLAYFHPCKLYMGNKLGDDVDWYARMTLETIWSDMIKMNGGFFHESAWNCFGPYLTLQLAHSFLYIGDIDRMDKCLAWAVGNAAYAKVSRDLTGQVWNVVQGCWNEQHNMPVASDFSWFPDRWWYMGDIPHGWACAELMFLIRDILFFEADEDGTPHIYIAPGIPQHWLTNGNGSIEIKNAPTIFGGSFGYSLNTDQPNRKITLQILSSPGKPVEYKFRCPFGSRVTGVTVQGTSAQPGIQGMNVSLPASTVKAIITFT
jgi:hypothetical protein